jgi:predicted nucleic acid-binding protein
VIALLDNTVMSNFALVGRPDLLRATFGDEVATPQQAFSELIAGAQQGRLPGLDWSWLPVWTLETVETPHYQQFLRRLNAGESACLAMAVHRGCRTVPEDRDAREFAHRLRIPLSGTLGVLVRLTDIGSLGLEQADALLSRMIAAGYRSPAVSLQELL